MMLRKRERNTRFQKTVGGECRVGMETWYGGRECHDAVFI